MMQTDIDGGPLNGRQFQKHSTTYIDSGYLAALRDQFAMAALTGLLGNDIPLVDEHQRVLTKICDFAKASYKYADAMMMARG